MLAMEKYVVATGKAAREDNPGKIADANIPWGRLGFNRGDLMHCPNNCPYGYRISQPDGATVVTCVCGVRFRVK